MADEFGTGKGATALLFSITSAWYFGLGLVTGRATDRFGPRVVLVVGAVFLGVGLVATSRVGSIWLGYVTYGLGAGTAVACAYVPMVATVGGWFARRRTAALGVAVAGIGAGTLIVAPLAEALIDAYGWRTAYAVLGVVGTAALLVAAALAERPPVAAASGPLDLRAVSRERGFVVLYLATVLVSFTLFVPFVFIKSYATERGIDASSAAALVGLIGASSIVGRLGLGALGGRWGPAVLLRASFALMAVSFVLWYLADSSLAMLTLFVIVLGVGYGGFIALSPAVVAALFGTADLGAILGALYTAAGVGGLAGPPLAGELIDRTSYDTAILVSMAIAALATTTLLALPIHHSGARASVS